MYRECLWHDSPAQYIHIFSIALFLSFFLLSQTLFRHHHLLILSPIYLLQICNCILTPTCMSVTDVNETYAHMACTSTVFQIQATVWHCWPLSSVSGGGTTQSTIQPLHIKSMQAAGKCTCGPDTY